MSIAIEVGDLAAETGTALAQFSGWAPSERAQFLVGYLGAEVKAVANGLATPDSTRRALGYVRANEIMLDQERAARQAGAAARDGAR